MNTFTPLRVVGLPETRLASERVPVPADIQAAFVALDAIVGRARRRGLHGAYALPAHAEQARELLAEAIKAAAGGL